MKLQTWFYALQSDGNGGQEVVVAKLLDNKTVLVARLDNDRFAKITVEDAKASLESVRNGKGEVVFVPGMVRADMDRKINRFFR